MRGPDWKRVRQIAAIAAGAVLCVTAALIASVFLPVAAPEFTQVKSGYTPSDAYLLDRHGVLIDSARIDFQVRRLEWVRLADVSPALTAAIIDGEDREFWEHRGVNWTHVLGALRDELVLHRRRGASTITMQVASLLQQRARKGNAVQLLNGKLAQARLALSLERHWTKPQILEAYLNLLTYRGELQGVAAAADRLAGKAPSSLSLPESLVIAALLPSPDADPARVVARACARAFLRQMATDCGSLERTAAALLDATRTLPGEGLAPQLAHSMLKFPGQHVRTTLDAGLQRKARDTLRTHLADLAHRNVRDGAVIIVDNDTGEVLAYVASVGPTSHAEQVDGVRARRQAGSTLKPFLYELALERHYLTAASLLDDSPLNLDTATGVYIPQDYDHEFKGLVSVRTSLAGSLNVPAVRTLVLVGVEPFRGRLHELGYAGITEAGDYYGYSLALGSAEVTLWEQAQAYRSLARGGILAPLTLFASNDSATGSRATGNSAVGESAAGDRAAGDRVMQPDASYIAADIMSDRAARAITFGLDNHLNTAFWSAVKTGTSKDMRDNWCIGFSRRFTVAVWVGNFEGDSMHDVSGVTGAAPIWHDLITAAQDNLESAPPSLPPDVSAANIRFSPAVEPPRRELFLGDAPPQPITVASPWGQVARVESPANGMIIALDPDVPPAHQRVPISVRGATVNMVLKLNDTPLGSATKSLLWTPQPGTYRLILEDEQGRAIDHVLFTVRGS